eukprot:TRINITY_DN7207_c0_g1_i10.p1 TRINITY_DN7207_c0_g1~~TRINITY_DN7207_c0_g1_i10.p1  ORF type:complete len:386 (-),score=61.15 TRINITY_DN7207_c0_g1_i10:112-1269(-)
MRKMAFEIAVKTGHARLGQFRGIETPNCFLYSRKGSAPHFSPDNLAKIPEVKALQVPVADFLNFPESLLEKAGGFNALCNLKNHLIYMTPRDLTSTEPTSGGDKQIYVNTPRGITQVNPASYMNVHRVSKPAIMASLSDEVGYDATPNRCRKSVDRSLKWLDACLEAHRAQQAESQVFATIQGGGQVKSRGICAKSMAERPVDGFALGGFGLGETAQLRYSLIDVILSELPENKPRSIALPGLPEEVLDCVSRGVDLIEGMYPYMLTEQGFAAIFPLNPAIHANEEQKDSAADAKEPDQKRPRHQTDPTTSIQDAQPSAPPSPLTIGSLNLRDKQYARDTRPFLPGCSCFACTNHTRAYTHHLLNADEILGSILLQLYVSGSRDA